MLPGCLLKHAVPTQPVIKVALINPSGRVIMRSQPLQDHSILQLLVLQLHKAGAADKLQDSLFGMKAEMV